MQTFSSGKINFENGINELLFSYRATSPTPEIRSPGELVFHRRMRTTYQPAMRPRTTPVSTSITTNNQPTNQPINCQRQSYHATTECTSKVSMCAPSYHTHQKVTRHFPNLAALQRSLLATRTDSTMDRFGKQES